MSKGQRWMTQKIKVLLFVLCLLLFISGNIMAAELTEEVDDVVEIPELDYQSFQLDNGLQVYVFEDDSLPLVEVSIYYNVGSIDEEQGLTGISHYLEHTMFLGTEALPPGRAEELIKSVGGSWNAGTSYDFTYYYQEVPADRLELALAIEADRMGNLIFDPEEIEREREVIRQERRTRVENDIVSAGMEKIQAAAFPESGLNHHVLGWMEDINNITVEDLKRHYDNYYVPNNAVLMVTGAADFYEVKALVEKYFGSYEAGEVERPDFTVAPQEEERVLEIEKETNVPYSIMYYKIPEGDHPHIMPINLFLYSLVNSQSSRVRERMQLEENLILGSGGMYYDLREPGFAIVYLIPYEEEHIQTVMGIYDNEVENILSKGYEKEEFQAVRKMITRDLVFMQREWEILAQHVALGELNYDNPELIIDRMRTINRLTPEEIIQEAGSYFRKDNRTIGHIVPVTE